MSGAKKAMVCVRCFTGIIATIVQAKAHGWSVWVGGAMCKRCVEAAPDRPAGAARWVAVPGLCDVMTRTFDGGTLTCLHCGSRRVMHPGDAARLVAKGWPMCCGYTMTFDKGRAP